MTLILLSACETASIHDEHSACILLPPIVQYPQSLLNQAADEVESRQAPALVELVKDYKLTREKIAVAEDILCVNEK